jgi:glucokinase
MRGSIGIDIGGTKIAVGAVGHDGRIEASLSLATEAALGFARAVDRIVLAVESVAAQAGWTLGDCDGIGIGCAGPVDPRRGLINNPYTLAGWQGCDIVSPLGEHFRVPVFLENDADAAALGECWLGAGRCFDPVVMLTFGTGVGGAALVEGRILRGVRGQHPEIGHIPASSEGPTCYCGIRGCLESLASGTAIASAGADIGLPDAASVFEAADRGESPAVRIVSRATEAAATAAWTLFHTFLPERLILGGGLMDRHFGRFAEAMNDRMRPATQFSTDDFRIVRAALGKDAGLVGAARLCHDHSNTVSQTP